VRELAQMYPNLGASDFPDELTTNTIRLDKTERLLLLSDSLTDPTSASAWL
jgi:hypothetical protein